MVGIWPLLQKLETFEGKLEELYQFYADKFAQNQEASEVFQKLSREERSHKQLIQFQLRMIMHDRKAFKDVSVDLSDIENCLAKVENALNSKQQLLDAVTFAIKMETSAAEMHYRTAMKHSNTELSQLLENLNQGDQMHLTYLKDFAKNLLPAN